MLGIFWDIKEKPVIKSDMTARLQNVYNGLKKTPGSNSQVKMVFTGSKQIRELNKTYRGKDKETDVLSFAELDTDKNFPALRDEKTLGEIYVNYDWVKVGKSPTKLAAKLFLHGYLHLLGYDHEKDMGEMAKLEKKLLKSLNAK